MTGPSRWRPTDALIRAGFASLVLAVAGVGVGRPDLVVLATPLAVFAAAALVRRPAGLPRVTSRLLHPSVREGEGTAVRTTVEGAGVEHAVVRMARRRWVTWRPPGGVAGRAASGDTVVVDVPVRSTRWGRRAAGDGLVAATSPWAGYRWGPEPLPGQTLTTLPLPGAFDTRAPAPHPIGLVGTNPSRRAGSGTELADIRPFQPGDRLRRVRWPVSLRTGTLHVTSTIAEEDARVLLVVDAGVDIGTGGGLGEPASTLDVAVRAAGAIAEHYLHRGDRVGLRVLGSTRHNQAPTRSGRRHLRRILDTLARVTPGEDRDADLTRASLGIPAGTVVIMLSPLLSDQSVATTLVLARRGLGVVAVDTLTDGARPVDDDVRARLAWRMRLLEREEVLRRMQHVGIPVVAWRGPGTLDEVLRKLGRRASMPRMAAR